MRNLFTVLISLVLIGCSASKAMNQPDAKDLSVLQSNTERKLVIGELGAPIHTEENEEGNKVDTYSFIQGYSKGAKAARAAGHVIMDIATLGIWEAAGSPIEAAASGDRVIVEIIYNEKNLLEHVRVLKGKEVVPDEYEKRKVSE